jgi:hypothetical protein
MNHNLIPEARVDKNGVTSIKHVRPEKPETASQRAMPVPTIAAAPVPVEAEMERPDYDVVVQENAEFLTRNEPVLMTLTDLTSLADLVDYASKRDDDGLDKVWSAGQLIKHGNIGAAKTIIAYIEEHQTGSDYDHHGNVFEAWNNGCDAGVFEQGKDYSANVKDQHYFDFIVKTFELSEYDHPMNEADAETIQQVADLYHALDGQVDADSVAEYWEERGDLDGYLEYAAEHNATRGGVL